MNGLVGLKESLKYALNAIHPTGTKLSGRGLKKMRGSIIKRYRGSYSIVINLGKDPANGKRKQQWYSVKGNKKQGIAINPLY